MEEEIRKAIKAALKMFGEYTYFDKGPEEVMEVTDFTDRLRALPASEIRDILVKVGQGDDAERKFVSSALMELQDLPQEDFDLLMADPLLEKLY